MLAFVYIPVIQRELDNFRSIWNNRRIRKQRNKELPTGVPEHIYSCPEKYGAKKCGFPVAEEQLSEVADQSGVLDTTDEYLDDAFRQECQRHIEDTNEIEPAQADNAYLYLRDNFDSNRLL